MSISVAPCSICGSFNHLTALCALTNNTITVSNRNASLFNVSDNLLDKYQLKDKDSELRDAHDEIEKLNNSIKILRNDTNNLMEQVLNAKKSSKRSHTMLKKVQKDNGQLNIELKIKIDQIRNLNKIIENFNIHS